MKNVTAKDIALMIDHSLLNPAFTMDEVKAGCALAAEYGCATVCVRPADVPAAMEILHDTPVKVTTVIGFPHGSNCTETKVFETLHAAEQGCSEVDMVLNIGRLLSGEFEYVENDTAAVVNAAHSKGLAIKVILENAYLNDSLIIKACVLCAKAGADFVKTSTGYAPSGATIHDLMLMRANTPARMQVKAAGGVRTLDDALLVRAAGGTRFGCTRTKAVIEEARVREKAGLLFLPEITNETEFPAVAAARK
jgi:deoxyribose-phosphate aldolase